MTLVTNEKTRVDERKSARERVQSRGLVPKRWYVHLLIWIAIVFMGFPFFYALLTSTQTNAQIFTYQITPGSSLADNWAVVSQQNIPLLMFNTFVVAALITLGKALLSIFSGMALVYFSFPGKYAVFGFILAGLMVPGEVTIIALYRLVALDLGWGNSWTALVIPAVASSTGTFLFRQHFASIPPDLSEAAQLDGASPLQFLFRILVPISWNTVGALVVIMFIGAWNSYAWPLLVITDPNAQMIQVGLSTLQAALEVGQTYGPVMLGAVIASIPPILVFIAMQKQFLSGFAITRDK